MQRLVGGKNHPPGEAPDHALGRSRGGFGTKLHLVTDGNGVPLQVLASAGQRHDCLFAEPVLTATEVHCANGRLRTRPRRVAGDKGYSYRAVRHYLRERRIKPVIPTRNDQKADPNFDRLTYRRRNVVERCVGLLSNDAERERLAMEGARKFEAMPMTDILARAISDLDDVIPA